MKPHVKEAAFSAAKWAFLLSAGIAVAPLISSLFMGISIDPVVAGQKFAVGIVILPILFILFWIFGIFRKKDIITGLDIPSSSSQLQTKTIQSKVSSSEQTTNALTGKVSVWNYVGLGAGIFMLLFLFIPQVISGTLPSQYYIGAVFWVGVIIYCFMNISSK